MRLLGFEVFHGDAQSGWLILRNGDYEVIFGPARRARKLAPQRAEATIRCQLLNKMTTLGMPDGSVVG